MLSPDAVCVKRESCLLTTALNLYLNRRWLESKDYDSVRARLGFEPMARNGRLQTCLYIRVRYSFLYISLPKHILWYWNETSQQVRLSSQNTCLNILLKSKLS